MQMHCTESVLATACSQCTHLFIQLTAFVDTADRMATFDPAPIGHHVTYRWTLTGATFFNVNDVTLTQNFTLQPAVGAYKQDNVLGYIGLTQPFHHHRHHRHHYHYRYNHFICLMNALQQKNNDMYVSSNKTGIQPWKYKYGVAVSTVTQ